MKIKKLYRRLYVYEGELDTLPRYFICKKKKHFKMLPYNDVIWLTLAEKFYYPVCTKE